MWSSIQVLPNQESKKSYTFEDIDLRESDAKLHKNRVKLWEQIQFKGWKSVSTVFLGTLADFRCICTMFVYRNEKYIYQASKRKILGRITYSK